MSAKKSSGNSGEDLRKSYNRHYSSYLGKYGISQPEKPIIEIIEDDEVEDVAEQSLSDVNEEVTVEDTTSPAVSPFPVSSEESSEPEETPEESVEEDLEQTVEFDVEADLEAEQTPSDAEERITETEEPKEEPLEEELEQTVEFDVEADIDNSPTETSVEEQTQPAQEENQEERVISVEFPTAEEEPEEEPEPEEIPDTEEAPAEEQGTVQEAPEPTPPVKPTPPRRPTPQPEESSGLRGMFANRRKDKKKATLPPRPEDDPTYVENRIIPLGADDPINLTVQEGFDARAARLKMQHEVASTRQVDPARWLEETMIDALRLNASDLHIIVEGDTRNLRARIRVDGKMRDFDYVQGTTAAVIMGRLKAATKLSSGGSYAPEETIYEITIDGEKRKARAVLFKVEDGGEALVMRLPLVGPIKQLKDLSFAEYNLQHVYDLLALPYKLIMLAGPMGSGKGSPAWEKILTPTGWTTYGEVAVGDKVIGSQGTETTVTGVYPRGVLDVFKVTFADGTHVTVDGDHLWNIASVNDTHSWETVETRELLNRVNKSDLRFTIPVVEPVEYETAEPLPADPHLIGLALGESLWDEHANEDELEQASQFYTELVNSDDSTIIAPTEERFAILNSLYEAVGIRNAEDEVTIALPPKSVEPVLSLVRSLGGVAYSITTATGWLASVVITYLPTQFTFEGGWKLPTREVASVEEVGQDEVICIQVDANDSLYVANDFIVTHNTTTAHGALLHVANRERTVWTVEDPVERRLPNLVQLEINEDNDAGFDVLLAKLLRADYNTLFLGEIRDVATASAAVKQAKAGRQVMSTIHADDNIKALMRLVELSGDTPMGALSAVGGVISQRLVRRLNPTWDGVNPDEKYRGRIPIHEILFVTDEVVEVMMKENSSLSEIKNAASSARGSTFSQDANRLIELGITDREELLSVIGEYETY